MAFRGGRRCCLSGRWPFGCIRCTGTGSVLAWPRGLWSPVRRLLVGSLPVPADDPSGPPPWADVGPDVGLEAGLYCAGEGVHGYAALDAVGDLLAADDGVAG